MATCPFSSPTNVRHHPAPPRIYHCATAQTNPTILCFSSSSFSSSKFILHRSFLFKRNSRSCRCHGTSPQPEPPSKINPAPISGVTSTFTRFQDTMQIFFAVLFWMSLFFWSSVWDGGNGGMRNKGSRFKK